MVLSIDEFAKKYPKTLLSDEEMYEITDGETARLRAKGRAVFMEKVADTKRQIQNTIPSEEWTTLGESNVQILD